MRMGVLRQSSFVKAIVCGALGLMSLPAPSAGIPQDKSVIEDGVYYGCGKPTRIAGYQFKVANTQISLPSYMTIRRNGTTLFSDPSPTGWEPPYTSATYAQLGKTVLILTLFDDCVDIQRKRLFIVYEDGYVSHQPVWTSNWNDGFFLENGALTYWSEWFCDPENKDREAAKSYVYVFSTGKKAFERQDVDESKYCERPPTKRFVKFRRPQAVAIK